MENVTRDIIADLYPLYVSGEASADTRRLVENFLEQDTEFARTLKDANRNLLPVYPPPPLPPDHELKTLAKVKRHLSGPVWLLPLAMLTSALAFGRIVSDTSFDVSPRKFIVTAMIAVCFWLAFFVKLFRGRRSVLLRLR
jgi:anti-sigma factor RsiW